MKKFSNGFDITTCVFVSFLTIISIHRNKREHHTMFQADFKVPNVGSCTFFGFHTHAKGRLSWCHFGTFKKGFQGTWCSSLSRVKKFPNGFDDATCMFESFLTILAIHRNKLEHRTTLQSGFTVSNVTYCTFLKFHTHWEPELLFVDFSIKFNLVKNKTLWSF